MRKIIKTIDKYHYKNCNYLKLTTGICNCPPKLKPKKLTK